MTTPPIGVAAENWHTVEALVSRMEAARRNDAAAGPPRASTPEERPRLRSLEPLKQAFALRDEDAEILVLALAPTAHPRLGWLYREFQAGDNTGLPGIDLVCELLQLSPEEAVTYRNRLVPDAPLVNRGLLVREAWRPYAPLRPTSRALRRVLGVKQDGSEIPGAVMMPTENGDGAGSARGDASMLSQLVCPSALVGQLERIARWHRHDGQLARWRVPVEHGPVILFAGPSGTGKTMAARAVAECAGLPLFRVDMGLLVSKYIGDTPKNINQLFDNAVREDAILLFDEAEGLFGKRGRVEDARDRYANMEVGHLLSRIERYPGICLLTTNLREHIDGAFLRRLDAVLHFNPPTAEERSRLWRRYLGEMIAPDDSLPTDLAGEPSLTGAQIASACRYAARCAAELEQGEQGRPPRARLVEAVAEGVWSELRKNGTNAIRSSLGPLERHLPER